MQLTNKEAETLGLTRPQIDLLITTKMNELENTGLSREEILYNQPRGLPLKNDAFFQYIKNNPLVRPMILLPSMTYNVIEMALRQDIGPDPSMGWGKENSFYRNSYTADKYIESYFAPLGPQAFNNDTYYYATNLNSKRAQKVNSEVDTPLTPFNPPLSARKMKEKFPRDIDIKEIDAKNTELLFTFMNKSGKIKNRDQNRVSGPVQTKAEKAIKRARQMQLLPSNSSLKSTDKQPLSTLISDVQNMCKKAIDPVTGRVYQYNELAKSRSQKFERDRNKQKIFDTEAQDSITIP